MCCALPFRCRQPIPHLLQGGAGRGEGADLLAGSFVRRTAVHAGDNGCLMNVQASTAFNDCVHAPLLVLGKCNRLRRAIKSDSTIRAPRCRGRQRAIPLRRRGSDSVTGTGNTTGEVLDLEAITALECPALVRAASPYKTSRRRAISSDCGAGAARWMAPWISVVLRALRDRVSIACETHRTTLARQDGISRRPSSGTVASIGVGLFVRHKARGRLPNTLARAGPLVYRSADLSHAMVTEVPYLSVQPDPAT
jgi:hypothetical protein